MSNINWKVRFTKENKAFIARFVVAVFIPVLIYYGIEVQDLTSWGSIWDIAVKAIQNPFVVGTMVINGINVLFDPTTQGLKDSDRALSYVSPKAKA